MVNGKAKNIISHTKISSTEVKDNYCNIVANINVIRFFDKEQHIVQGNDILAITIWQLC